MRNSKYREGKQFLQDLTVCRLRSLDLNSCLSPRKVSHTYLHIVSTPFQKEDIEECKHLTQTNPFQIVKFQAPVRTPLSGRTGGGPSGCPRLSLSILPPGCRHLPDHIASIPASFQGQLALLSDLRVWNAEDFHTGESRLWWLNTRSPAGLRGHSFFTEGRTLFSDV